MSLSCLIYILDVISFRENSSFVPFLITCCVWREYVRILTSLLLPFFLNE